MTNSLEVSEAIARAWLTEMQRCVREQDYQRCRKIFADDAVGFGTSAYMVRGLDRLELDQWRRIWPTIEAFTFLEDEMVFRRAGDTIWLACPWESTRRDTRSGNTGRPGRITAILECRDGVWLAVHTHHSVSPVL